MSPDAAAGLQGHPFSGNVRELKALVYDLVGRTTGKVVAAQDFRRALSGGGGPGQPPGSEMDAAWVERLERLPTLREASRLFVAEALRRTGNNQSLAAALLGITPQALSQRLKRHQD